MANVYFRWLNKDSALATIPVPLRTTRENFGWCPPQTRSETAWWWWCLALNGSKIFPAFSWRSKKIRLNTKVSCAKSLKHLGAAPMEMPATLPMVTHQNLTIVLLISRCCFRGTEKDFILAFQCPIFMMFMLMKQILPNNIFVLQKPYIFLLKFPSE